MFKLLRLMLLCAMLYGAFQLGGILQDRQALSQDIIRLHVVANSDSQQDQTLKLQVRDAVNSYLSEAMTAENVDQAKAFLSENLNEIRNVALEVLRSAGCGEDVGVSLSREEFDTREYETFTLPAGIYESLRITIGDGEGKNWWCVVFPSLCLPETPREFEAEAAGSGFSETLTETVSNDRQPEIRFWVLDFFGRVQNFFHRQ